MGRWNDEPLDEPLDKTWWWGGISCRQPVAAVMLDAMDGIDSMDCMEISRPRLRVRLLRDGAALPRYHSEAAAGLDLAACPSDGQAVSLAPGEIRLIPCGFSMALPPGWEGQIRPRSGLALRFGISMPNAPGTIDADYRGEVAVPLINHGQAAFVVEPGMRIAQMVIAPVAHAEIEMVADLEKTSRGAGGFGSTGT